MKKTIAVMIASGLFTAPVQAAEWNEAKGGTFVGARLMLAGWNASSNGAAAQLLEKAEEFLVECLREQADHVDAMWMLAALRAARSDDRGLAALAPGLSASVADPRYQLMAAICWLVAGDTAKAIEAARKVEAHRELGAEARFVLAWVSLKRRPENLPN